MKPRVLGILLLATLLIRLLACIPVSAPRSLDECYYMMVADNLAQGRGLTSDIVWNHLRGVQGLELPTPSNRFWMPLSSLLLAIPFKIFGRGYRVAQLTMALFSSILPILGYILASASFRDRLRPLLVWAGVLFSPWFFLYWGTPDNFGLFGAMAAGALMLFHLCARVAAPRPALALGAGILSGLAHLSRADGLLVIGCGVLFLFWHYLRGSRQGKRAFFLSLALVVLGYLLVMGPWFLRNYRVFGAPLPPDGKATVFMTSYNQLMFYKNQPTPRAFFQRGFGAILKEKLKISRVGLTFWIAGMAGFIMLPGFLFWLLTFRPGRGENIHALYASLYTLALLLVFTYPSQRGTLWHTAAASVPLVLVAGVRGWWNAGILAGRRILGKGVKASWRLGRGLAVFAVAVYCLMAIPFSMRYLSLWDEEYNPYSRAFEYVARQRAESNGADTSAKPVLMTGRPGLANYCQGFSAVVTPLDGPEAIEALLRDIKVDFIVERGKVLNRLLERQGPWRQAAEFGSVTVVEIIKDGEG